MPSGEHQGRTNVHEAGERPTQSTRTRRRRTDHAGVLEHADMFFLGRVNGRPGRCVQGGGQVDRLNGDVDAVRLLLHRECTRDLLLRFGETKVRFAQFVGQLVGIFKIDVEYFGEAAFDNDVWLQGEKNEKSD